MIRRALSSFVRSPLRAFLVVVSVSVTLFVVCAPIAASRFPPMTDLPFHAAHSSILRHYWDPAWHFHEQFEITPVAVPYLLHYALGALLMLVMKPLAAVKTATVLVLMLVPGGMAVLLHGMKRSPLGALLTLPLAYSTLAHWGFINFIGALGLFAASVGLAMMVVDRPTRARRIGLAAALVLLFFTHIFRFPMGLAAVIGTAVFLYPATGRLRPIALPVLPSVVLFGVWLVVRPKTLDTGGMELHLDVGRVRELWPLLWSGFQGPREMELAGIFAWVAGIVGGASLVAAIVERQRGGATAEEDRFRVGAWLVVATCAAVFLGLFLTLPMQIGAWWYVYPREATAATYMAVALLPGLPRSVAWRAPMVIVVAAAALAYGQFMRVSYAAFNEQTDDFVKIAAQLPRAPRLMYLIFDHGGSARQTTPFIHLPAYVQAERGGFLGFNFAAFGAAPIVFRSPSDPEAVLPPRVPHRWEWQPNLFKVKEHGPFFDWFLVRVGRSPDSLFAADPEIKRVDHVGMWWLYKRTRGKR